MTGLFLLGAKHTVSETGRQEFGLTVKNVRRASVVKSKTS